VAAKAGQIIVEGCKTAILPLVLNTVAREKSDRRQRLALVSQTEVHMHGRNFIIGGDFRQSLAHELNQWRALFARSGEKPMAGYRRERDADQHFRIILN